MPVSYTIDKKRQLVLTRAWGVLTDAELLTHKDLLSRDPDVGTSVGELSDVRAVERLDVTTEGVKAMVAHDSTNADGAGFRLALVVGSDEVFGMARMYSQRSDSGSHHVSVFRSLVEAEAWLAAGPPPDRSAK